MIRTMLQGKLHRVKVTHADLHYEGSCAIDWIFLTQPVFSKTKPLISGMSPTAKRSPPMQSQQNVVRELFLLTVRRPTAPVSAILSSSPASLLMPDEEARTWRPNVAYFEGDNEMKRTAKAIPVQVA